MAKKKRIKYDKGDAYCLKCNTLALRSEKYDSYYCDKCNIWLEYRCQDPQCKLCKSRPIRPGRKKKRKVIEWD